MRVLPVVGRMTSRAVRFVLCRGPIGGFGFAGMALDAGPGVIAGVARRRVRKHERRPRRGSAVADVAFTRGHEMAAGFSGRAFVVVAVAAATDDVAVIDPAGGVLKCNRGVAGVAVGGHLRVAGVLAFGKFVVVAGIAAAGDVVVMALGRFPITGIVAGPAIIRGGDVTAGFTGRDPVVVTGNATAAAGFGVIKTRRAPRQRAMAFRAFGSCLDM